MALYLEKHKTATGVGRTQVLPIKIVEGRYMTPIVLAYFVVMLVLQINYIYKHEKC
jgi:hypothetical protein